MRTADPPFGPRNEDWVYAKDLKDGMVLRDPGRGFFEVSHVCQDSHAGLTRFVRVYEDGNQVPYSCGDGMAFIRKKHRPKRWPVIPEESELELDEDPPWALSRAEWNTRHLAALSFANFQQQMAEAEKRRRSDEREAERAVSSSAPVVPGVPGNRVEREGRDAADTVPSLRGLDPEVAPAPGRRLNWPALLLPVLCALAGANAAAMTVSYQWGSGPGPLAMIVLVLWIMLVQRTSGPPKPGLKELLSPASKPPMSHLPPAGKTLTREPSLSDDLREYVMSQLHEAGQDAAPRHWTVSPAWLDDLRQVPADSNLTWSETADGITYLAGYEVMVGEQYGPPSLEKM